jgi:hypothetical protein
MALRYPPSKVLGPARAAVASIGFPRLQSMPSTGCGIAGASYLCKNFGRPGFSDGVSSFGVPDCLTLPSLVPSSLPSFLTYPTRLSKQARFLDGAR